MCVPCAPQLEGCTVRARLQAIRGMDQSTRVTPLDGVTEGWATRQLDMDVFDG